MTKPAPITIPANTGTSEMLPRYPRTPIEKRAISRAPVFAFDMKALIFRAVRDNQPRVVEYLFGISTMPLDTLDLNGNTMLYVAAQSNAVDTLRLLLSMGLHASDVSNHNHETALFAAARAGAHTAVSLLIQFCDINSRNTDGDTALHVAAQAGFTRIVELLLQSNATIDAKNHQGRTPLWMAVHHQRIDAVCCLLRRGANARLQDVHGISPVDEAVANIHRVIETFVKEDFVFRSSQNFF